MQTRSFISGLSKLKCVRDGKLFICLERAESEGFLFPRIIADFDLKAAIKSNKPSTTEPAAEWLAIGSARFTLLLTLLETLDFHGGSAILTAW
jgi:hypothetical protein